MPYPLASLSKRTIRGDVATALGDNLPFTTSGGGSTTTAVVASFGGMPLASIQNQYVLLESLLNDGTWRVASNFAPATGTITVRRAYANSVLTATDGHLHEFSPDLYTRAINEAIRQCYHAVYKPVLHHTFVRQPGTQRTLPLPRGMERVMRVMEDRRASDRLRDYFNRSTNTTDPGNNWIVDSGTWGISSESLYCVSDLNTDYLEATTNPQLKNGVIQAVVRGTLNSGATYRTPALIFRFDTAAGDYLLVRLLNGACDLRKVESNTTESSLTTASLTTADGTDYTVRIMFDGSWVRVWVDDVEVITYELQGPNLKYLGYDEGGDSSFGSSYGQIAIRLDKNGNPATAARVRDYFAHELVGTAERGDWERSYDGRMITLGTRNRGTSLAEGRMIWIEGMAELTTLATDTFESLTTDSTATVELQQTDPAYDVLVQWAAYRVLWYAAQPAFTANPEKRQEYAARAQDQMQMATAARQRKAMRFLMRRWG